jgi:DNA-binding ferritin-like protein
MSVKFYHWRTSSYSTHKATDELYGDLNDNIDEFAETLMGAMGRRILAPDNLHLTIPKDNKHMESLIDESIKLLSKHDFAHIAKVYHTSATDLMNIRDEMVGQLHKTKYLLSLNGSKK